MRTLLLLALATGLLITGCDAGAPNLSPSATSLPSGSSWTSGAPPAGGAPSPSQTLPGQTIALLTQPPAPPNAACMEALMVGHLAVDPRSGLGVAGGDGMVTPVAWPNGYSARLIETTLVLFDHEGTPLARVGDPVELGGGFGDAFWYPCHGQLSVPGR